MTMTAPPPPADDPPRPPLAIAVVGMSALFPGSRDLAGFWRDVLSGRDRIGDVPPTHWLIEDHYDPDPAAVDKTYCRRGGFLSPLPFDPLDFGIPPNALPATDTAQLLALVAARRVLDDAARTRSRAVDPDRISVVLGVASTTELVGAMGARMQRPVWRKALRDAGLPESQVTEACDRIAACYPAWQESSFPGLLGNVVAGRIANRLDLGGTNCVVDAACASSLAAVSLAIKELETGDSDMVVTGGVDALNDIMMYMCFSKTPAFSPTGDCRPFAADADGTLIGEGVGLLALRRLADAERDGDAIYAVIRGVGASSDGRASSVYAPRPEGQAKALTRAYARAGHSPATVELVEAHGTGTRAGDAAEVRALTSVFGPAAGGRRGFCALGSVKSQIGHTKAAAGAAGLVKAVMALHAKALPPTIKVERPNPALALADGPFYLGTRARPWVRGADHPRRASVSSFGFGGSNFHVALEEYTGAGRRPPRARAWPDELVLLSGASAADLARAAVAAAEEASSGAGLAHVATRAAAAFDAGAPARLALVAADEAELAALARRAAELARAGDEADAELGAPGDTRPGHPDLCFGFGALEPGATAFLFPGQGSQYAGMGAAAALAFDGARRPWDEAAGAEAFRAAPLHDVAFPPAAFDAEQAAAHERRLTEMANAQPAIAAVSLGLLDVLDVCGLRPDAVAGHSFGELTALAAAGAIDARDLLAVARRRGELMADAARDADGAMLACAAGGEAVRAALQQRLGAAAADLVVANDNAPAQVVLAGPTAAIAAAKTALDAAGIAAARLPVATAFHSPIVAGACAPFWRHLGALPLRAPRIPVYGNGDGAPYPGAPSEIARQLADQLARPVQFRAMVERMHADGIRRFIEVGPGRVLTGLVGACLDGRPHQVVALDDRKAGGLRALFRGLGRLAAAGVAIDLAALMRDAPPPPAVARPPAHAVMISGANLGKPYPPAGGAAALPPPNPERPTTAAPPAFAAPVAPPPAGAAPTTLAAPMPAPPALAAPTTTPPAAASPYERIHQATVEAHRHYQDLMAASHRSFLEVAARALAEVGAGAGAGADAGARLPARTFAAAPTVALAPSAPEPTHAPAAAPPAPPFAAAPPPAAASHAAPAPAAATVDPARVLIEIVADKTGYPADMLNLDLEMEAGLGIDSIKQVEILSALQERLPGLPALAPPISRACARCATSRPASARPTRRHRLRPPPRLRWRPRRSRRTPPPPHRPRWRSPRLASSPRPPPTSPWPRAAPATRST
jgi:polyketide-type polyunsaturated fatty acid synthase PfaA